MLKNAGIIFFVQVHSLSYHLLQQHVHAFILPHDNIHHPQHSLRQRRTSPLFLSETVDSFDAVDDPLEKFGRENLQQYFDFPIDSCKFFPFLYTFAAHRSKKFTIDTCTLQFPIY
jgi:hypothetical protein